MEALIHKAMRERRLSFKEALNQAVRAGFTARDPAPGFRSPTYHMGFEPAVPLDKALRLAAELEDEELIRGLASHK